jgi:hypothetical protein
VNVPLNLAVNNGQVLALSSSPVPMMHCVLLGHLESRASIPVKSLHLYIHSLYRSFFWKINWIRKLLLFVDAVYKYI